MASFFYSAQLSFAPLPLFIKEQKSAIMLQIKAGDPDLMALKMPQVQKAIFSRDKLLYLSRRKEEEEELLKSAKKNSREKAIYSCINGKKV